MSARGLCLVSFYEYPGLGCRAQKSDSALGIHDTSVHRQDMAQMCTFLHSICSHWCCQNLPAFFLQLTSFWLEQQLCLPEAACLPSAVCNFFWFLSRSAVAGFHFPSSCSALNELGSLAHSNCFSQIKVWFLQRSSSNSPLSNSQ